MAHVALPTGAQCVGDGLTEIAVQCTATGKLNSPFA
jgi:hypothetical protein